MSPVCSNCGASDFVWANDLKTGSIGGGTLSLRSRGELSLGTRICRSCGHADLFLKDPSVLRMPHTWKPGEFVPIPSRPATDPAPHSHHGSSASAAPVPSVSAAPAPATPPSPPPPVAPPPSPPSPPSEVPPPTADPAPPATPEASSSPTPPTEAGTTEESTAPARRTGRRRSARSKSSDSD